MKSYVFNIKNSTAVKAFGYSSEGKLIVSYDGISAYQSESTIPDSNFNAFMNKPLFSGSSFGANLSKFLKELNVKLTKLSHVVSEQLLKTLIDESEWSGSIESMNSGAAPLANKQSISSIKENISSWLNNAQATSPPNGSESWAW